MPASARLRVDSKGDRQPTADRHTQHLGNDGSAHHCSKAGQPGGSGGAAGHRRREPRLQGGGSTIQNVVDVKGKELRVGAKTDQIKCGHHHGAGIAKRVGAGAYDAEDQRQ